MRTRTVPRIGDIRVAMTVIGLLIAFARVSPAAILVWQATLFDDLNNPVGFIQADYDDESGVTGFPGGVISDQTTFFFTTGVLLSVDASVFTNAPAIPELENGLTRTDANRVEPALAVIPIPGNLLLVEGPATAFGMADEGIFSWTFNVVGGLNFFLNNQDFGLIGTDPVTSDFIFLPLGTMSNFTPIPEVSSIQLGLVCLILIATLAAIHRNRRLGTIHVG